ncbi:MAG: ABC transporter permease [Pseudobdellovibrio sp.]
MNNFLTDVLTLVEINLKARYRQTFIGFFWVIANPVLLFFVQYVILSKVLAESPADFALYLFTGLLPWFYLSQTAEMGCTLLYYSANLVKNLKIHPFKLIAGLALENFINLISSALVVFGILRCFYDLSTVHLLNFFVCSSALLIIVTLFTFICALLNILLKDTKYILHFVFTLLYFSTPSFYHIEKLPPLYRKIISLNPLYWLMTLYRLDRTGENVYFVIAINFAFIILLTLSSIYLWKKLKAAVYLKL